MFSSNWRCLVFTGISRMAYPRGTSWVICVNMVSLDLTSSYAISPKSDICLSLPGVCRMWPDHTTHASISLSFNICFGKVMANCPPPGPPAHSFGALVLWHWGCGGGQAARLSDSCTQDGPWRTLKPQVHTGTSFGYRRNLAFGKYFPAFVDDQILPRYKICTELFERPQSNFLPTFLHSYFLFLFLLFLYGLIKHSKRTRHIF